jgi:hypothetical protein
MVHSEDAGVPVAGFIDKSRTTVEPGLPVPDDSPNATVCAKDWDTQPNKAARTTGKPRSAEETRIFLNRKPCVHAERPTATIYMPNNCGVHGSVQRSLLFFEPEETDVDACLVLGDYSRLFFDYSCRFPG